MGVGTRDRPHSESVNSIRWPLLMNSTAPVRDFRNGAPPDIATTRDSTAANPRRFWNYDTLCWQ